MSNYTQTTFFAPKDALLSGNPLKLVVGAAYDVEFAAIATAIATKLDGTNAANPTGSVGLAAVNGSLSTYMRSDAAPALSQAIVPTWTGLHTFSGVSGGDILRWTDGTVSGSFQTTAINGYTGTTSNHAFNIVTNNIPRLDIANDGSSIKGWGPVAGAVVDMTPDTGSFTATLNGCTSAITGTAQWVRVGKLVMLTLPALTGTSNSVSMTVSGLPTAIQPLTIAIQNIPVGSAENNGVQGNTNVAAQVLGVSNTITFTLAGSAVGWTATGTKGLPNTSTLCYSLT